MLWKMIISLLAGTLWQNIDNFCGFPSISGIPWSCGNKEFLLISEQVFDSDHIPSQQKKNPVGFILAILYQIREDKKFPLSLFQK